MTETYITISHLDDFMSADFISVGMKLVLKKVPNSYDDESISVYSEKGTRVGYVANSCASVAHGCHSAGYIYRDFDSEAACTVRFIINDIAIAEFLTDRKAEEKKTA